MKSILLLLGLGGMIMNLIAMPSAELPEGRVCGTEKNYIKEETKSPKELRYMSKKMYLLKTGKSVNTERNHKKQQNFWGKGSPTRVRFPTHLVEWENFNRNKWNLNAVRS